MPRRGLQPITKILRRNRNILDAARTRIMKSRELCLTARNRIQEPWSDEDRTLPSSPSVNGGHDIKSTRRAAKATRKASQNVRRKSVLLRSAAELTIQHSVALRAQNRGQSEAT
jgi:hypothetical protein